MRARIFIRLASVLVIVFLISTVSANAQPAARETAVLTRDADVYFYPSSASSKLGRLNAGVSVKVSAVMDDWIEIEYLLRRVYVERGALSATAAQTNAAVGVTLVGRTLYVCRDVSLERAAGLSAIGLKAGDQVTLLGVNGNAADVLSNIWPGHVPLDALAADEELCYPLNTSGDSIEELETRLEALGYFDGVPDGLFDVLTAEAVLRFRAQAGLGDEFIMDEATEARLFSDDAPRSFILLADLHPNDTGNSVRRLQERLRSKGYLETNVLGHYDTLTVQAVMLYQSMERMESSGIADPDTLSRLFSGTARNLPRNLMSVTRDTAQYLPGGVSLLDWFDSDISNIFAIGTVAEITDITTGLTWHEMRRGGYNHADVQPLTAEDTASFQTAVGGKWTWERRPVWVTIDGVRYAASMNCMPHGDGAIAGNNFAGHHCVHFLNSRTHGTDNLDEFHQLCVKTAAATDYVAALETWKAANEEMIGTSDDD